MKTTQQCIYDTNGKEVTRITTARHPDGFRMYVTTNYGKFCYGDLKHFLNEVIKDKPDVIKGYADEGGKLEVFILSHDGALNEIQVIKWRNCYAQTKFIELIYND